jgi:hypothetical protein
MLKYNQRVERREGVESFKAEVTTLIGTVFLCAHSNSESSHCAVYLLNELVWGAFLGTYLSYKGCKVLPVMASRNGTMVVSS